jgi:hypothetical protein
VPDAQKVVQAAGGSNSAYCRDDFTCHSSQKCARMREFLSAGGYLDANGPVFLQLPRMGSMPEVPYSGENHGDSKTVRSVDHVLVLY